MCNPRKHIAPGIYNPRKHITPGDLQPPETYNPPRLFNPGSTQSPAIYNPPRIFNPPETSATEVDYKKHISCGQIIGTAEAAARAACKRGLSPHLEIGVSNILTPNKL